MIHRQVGRWLGILGATTVAAVACDSRNTTPIVPTSPAVTSIEISGLVSIPRVGQMLQLTATAILADGTRRDATSTAAWRTSNASIAAISVTGLLTINGAGAAEVSATLEGVTNTLRVVVPESVPPAVTYTITGVVHETAPTEDVEVGNARVEVVGSGPLAGQAFMTDASGRFTLPPVSHTDVALPVSSGNVYLVLFTGDVDLCSAWAMQATHPS